MLLPAGCIRWIVTVGNSEWAGYLHGGLHADDPRSIASAMNAALLQCLLNACSHVSRDLMVDPLACMHFHPIRPTSSWSSESVKQQHTVRAIINARTTRKADIVCYQSGA